MRDAVRVLIRLIRQKLGRVGEFISLHLVLVQAVFALLFFTPVLNVFRPILLPLLPVSVRHAHAYPEIHVRGLTTSLTGYVKEEIRAVARIGGGGRETRIELPVVARPHVA